MDEEQFNFRPRLYIHNVILHTIHKLQPFSQYCDLVSLNNYFEVAVVLYGVCVSIFIHEQRDLQSIPKLFMAVLFTFTVFTRKLLKRSFRSNVFVRFRLV